MPIKNYTSKVPAAQSVQEIQNSLVKHGAIGVLLEYEKGTGKIESLKFKLDMQGKDVAFRLPIDWRKFQAVLKEDRVSRWKDDDFAYRVAWRCIRDWVLSQMALYETQMVEIQQVFLPYAMSSDGVSTLYDQVLKGNLLSAPKE